MPDGSVVTDPATGDLIVTSGRPDQAGLTPPVLTHDVNLAMVMTDQALTSVGTALTENLSHDQRSQSDREKLTKRFIEAMGIGPESAPDDYKYEFSDTSDNPLLLKALMTFQAKALSALMPSPDAVAIAVSDIDIDQIEDPAIRKQAGKKIDAAVRRVTAYYNHYFLRDLTTYVEDTDLIIADTGLTGLGIRRVIVDKSYTKTPVQPVHVAPEDLIFSYDTKNFRGSGRFAHRYTVDASDLVRGMQNGKYRMADVVASVFFDRSVVTDIKDHIYGIHDTMLSDAAHVMYDVFTYMFLADDPHPGLQARPYVVTIHASTQEVLSIRRNWVEGDLEECPIEHFVGYVYSPGRNAVTAVGLGAILTNMTLALRKAQRRALDAAYLANHPSGFIAGGVSIRDDATPFVPGELRPVDVANGDLRQSIVTNIFPGPNEGLLGLYDRMAKNGQELGSISSIDFASMMKSGVAAGPALAAYDESTEFQTSVHRRLYNAHLTELTLVHNQMRTIFGGQRVVYGTGKFLEPDDLFMTQLRPAMKPGHVSRQRAVMEAQAVLEQATANPDIVNKREAITRFLSVIGAYDLGALILPDPAETPVQPGDPVNEYLRLMRGEPLRAGAEQNHMAHIDAHVSQLGMIQTSQLPVQQGEAAAAALSAHIAEHEALNLAVQVAAAMGIPLDAFVDGLPPEMELQIAPMIAAAIQAIEAQRKPNDGEDPKVTLEKVRIEGKAMVEEIKSQREQLKIDADKAIARMQEEAETYRNDRDNAAAILIAKMKTPPIARPNTHPTDPDPAPHMAGNNADP